MKGGSEKRMNMKDPQAARHAGRVQGGISRKKGVMSIKRTVKEIEAKSIIVPSKLPDADYVVNPYVGCIFGCSYCYASFMGRYVSESVENWGNYVYVKRNAVELFTAELPRLRGKSPTPSILLSSVTDPYQGAERKYRLVRGILGIAAQAKYQGIVSILTKSPLVLRDVDLLKAIPAVEVGITVTTTDDRISRILEVRAPLASRRLSTLQKLNAEGIETYAFVGPLLPHFQYDPRLLDLLFESLAATGTKRLYVEHMNLSPYIRTRYSSMLADQDSSWRVAVQPGDKAALDDLVKALLQKHGLELALGEVLVHNRKP